MAGGEGRKQILQEWIAFRVGTVRRDCNGVSTMDARRILEGLMIAFLNLDEVIRIVREEDDPKRSCQDLQDHRDPGRRNPQYPPAQWLEEMKLRAEQDELIIGRRTRNPLKSNAAQTRSRRKSGRRRNLQRRPPVTIVQRDAARALDETDLSRCRGVRRGSPTGARRTRAGFARPRTEVDPRRPSYAHPVTHDLNRHGQGNLSAVFVDRGRAPLRVDGNKNASPGAKGAG